MQLTPLGAVTAAKLGSFLQEFGAIGRAHWLCRECRALHPAAQLRCDRPAPALEDQGRPAA